jgi:hypothetical protein
LFCANDGILKQLNDKAAPRRAAVDRPLAPCDDPIDSRP